MDDRCLLQACLQLARLPRKVLLYSIRHAIDLDSPHLVVRLVGIAHELLVVIRVERLRWPPQNPEIGRQALPDVENDLGEVVLKMMNLARARVLDTARQFQCSRCQRLILLNSTTPERFQRWGLLHACLLYTSPSPRD